ncbi:MAG: TrkH family potassium uptake protein [Acidimicrobiales bacterium]
MPRPVAARPPQVVAASFIVLITVGTVLLMLPFASHDGSVGFVEAFFTSTSAVCVTGLAVVDTGSDFTAFGQAVILTLFQLGGLGLLTIGTLLALATGRRLGVGTRHVVKEQLSVTDLGGVLTHLRAVAVLVVVAESIGALVLWLRFSTTETTDAGLWSAVFHSVSAFNNAGFSLNTDSLVAYVSDPVVNLTIAGLIVVGGLGFVVTSDVLKWLLNRGSRRRSLALHTKIALVSTFFLTAAGTTLILMVEWANPATLGPLDTGGRLLASLFQSVTPRTAGFNTLDYGEMTTAGLLVTMLLMFIGGNPGSTAGGVRTVTVFVLVASVWSVIRGRREATAFGRTISSTTQIRAASIVVVAALTGGAAVTLLAVFEPDIELGALLFETISALGTVGLSTGITPELGTPARLVLIAVMYLGRVGLLSFAIALIDPGPSQRVRRPAEDVVVG